MSFRRTRITPRIVRPHRVVERLEGRRLLAILTVTTTADDGPGSLRQALVDAALNAEADTIRFDVPGPSTVHTISPPSPLPVVPAQTVIDGTTQPGYAGSPLIELEGSNAGDAADGLSVSAQGTVRGLVINRFAGNGLIVAADCVVQRNYIGTDAAGQVALPNGGAGVEVISHRSVVGGARAAEGGLGDGNVISGNRLAGVWLRGGLGSPNQVTVSGNFIGTNAQGTAAVGNGGEGVFVEGGSSSVIGGENAGNVISGNGASGVRVGGSAAELVVAGNMIGTDAAGTTALGNGASPDAPFRDGVTSDTMRLTLGGANAALRNVISGNAAAGVRVRSGGDRIHKTLDVAGNYIGTDASGTHRLGNGTDGVWLTGVQGDASATVRSNLISGNAGDGVRLDGAGYDYTGDRVSVSGNFIGTDAAGAAALGNAGHGVNVLGAVRASIGLATTPRTPGSPVRFGSDTGNLISANGLSGVHAADVLPRDPTALRNGFDLTVQGNYIGTDATGNVDLGNGADGVTADGGEGGQAQVFGSLVSGNAADGIHFAHVTVDPGKGIRGNFIGTNAAGTAALGNGGDGVELEGSARLGVGASSPFNPKGVDQASTGMNLISANGGNGIYLTGTPDPSARFPQHGIEANHIGTDVTAAAPLGNAGSGIYVDSPGAHFIGSTNTPGNVISANGGDGITIVGPAAGAVRVTNNYVGTDAQGATVPGLGNARNGVAIINSSQNRVESYSYLGSFIAGNGGSGVYVEGADAQDNTVSQVRIFDNGGLGIDLAPAPGETGVTPNDPLDADSGPNGLQNFPVIRSVVVGDAGTLVRYDMRGQPNTKYQIEIYTSPAADPSGSGEGMTLFSFVSVTTDAGGNASGILDSQASAGLAGRFFTATATPYVSLFYSGPTSEFSPAVQATTAGPSSVAARHVFYNHSAFDGNDAAATPADDAAVAPDKEALLPGQSAGSANVTSFTRGLNGVMVDVNDLAPGATRSLSADDFTFRFVTAPGGRESGPASPPSGVTVRRGAGAGGADRITLVWPDYAPAAGGPAATALANGWLEITVKAGARTGLAEPDVFYFGNLIGDTADTSGSLRVSALDLAAVKRALNSDSPVTGHFDFNRDGRVNALDLATARSNLNRSLATLPSSVGPVANDFRADETTAPNVLL